MEHVLLRAIEIMFNFAAWNKNNKKMAIPVTNIPVLTGEVAERFIEQCEYNAEHLRGSEWQGDFEDVYKELIARSPILQ
jgi:hypothetical protein